MSEEKLPTEGRDEQLSPEQAHESENNATVDGPVQPKIIGGIHEATPDSAQQPQVTPVAPPPFVQQGYSQPGAQGQPGVYGQPAPYPQQGQPGTGQSEQYVQHFPQQPFSSQNAQPFSQQASGGFNGFVGNGYPVRSPFDAKSLVTNPDQRWPLLGAIAGMFIFLGSIMPWASFWGYSVNGLDGDGWFTLIAGIGIIALSVCYLLLASLRGKMWVPIVSAVLSAISLLVAIVDINSVSSERVDMGIGLVIILIFAVLSIVASALHIVEIFKRKQMHF